jgi:hypothetical protein
LGIGPLLAGLPVRLDVLAKLLAGFDLLRKQVGAGGRYVARARLSIDDANDAVVGTVPRCRPIGAGAAGLVATKVVHREGPSAHRHGLGQLASEVSDGRRRIVVFPGRHSRDVRPAQRPGLTRKFLGGK